MQYFIVGLGNPGEEYRDTRHNTGRLFLEYLRKKNGFADWESDKRKALVSEGKIGKKKAILIEPETFMNNSGKAVALFVKNKKDASRTIVAYDDLDLPIGTMKISFNRGSGGHNGLESVIKALKTREFVRFRVGISPATPSGKIRKPSGDKDVEKHILGNFKEKETEALKKVFKKAAEALSTLVDEGTETAMSRFN
ncbi:aminoacyl-tRNA hydrolase [Candidatus Parcubacteria bacterium]|nr:aminoacyl-tRNA hydrolase [Candidatus Parcubacteria bacterium]